MTKEQKKETIRKTYCDLNSAKDRIYHAAEALSDAGMGADAEALMKIIYRIESFQHRYQ